MYDDKYVLKVVQHALPWITERQPLPSYCSQTGWKIASVLFTNLHQQQRCLHCPWKYPKDKVRYMPLLYQQSKTPPLPEATWGMRTLVVWSKAAREQLITNNLSWLHKIKQDLLLAAIWNFKNAGTIPFCKAPTESILPRMTEICRLPKDLRKTVTNANIGDISDT